MALGEFKDLPRTASDKVLLDKHLIFIRIQNIEIKKVLLQ